MERIASTIMIVVILCIPFLPVFWRISHALIMPTYDLVQNFELQHTDDNIQTHEIVGRWEGEIEAGDGQYLWAALEFSDNGVVTASRRNNAHSGYSFGLLELYDVIYKNWEYRDGVLYIDELSEWIRSPIEFPLETPLETGQYYERPPQQAVFYDISEDQLTIEWGEFSGIYTRQPATEWVDFNENQQY